jgi:hypothetical protein
VLQKLHRRVFLDKLTRDEATLYISFYVEAANRDAFMAGASGHAVLVCTLCCGMHVRCVPGLQLRGRAAMVWLPTFCLLLACLLPSCVCLPAVKQDLLLAFVDCVERNGAKLARQRLQLEVLPSVLPPGDVGGVGGMAGSIIDVPALPQPVDVTATPAAPSPSSNGGGGSSSGSSSSGGSGTSTAKESSSSGGSSTSGSAGSSSAGSGAKEGSASPTSSSSSGGSSNSGSGKGVAATAPSFAGSPSPQQQAAVAAAAAILRNPAALNKIAAAISPDDIIASTQQGTNIMASYDEINVTNVNFGSSGGSGSQR